MPIVREGEIVLVKTFFFGILLGIAAAAGALYAFPVVDQHREASMVSVSPNGGNIEAFHINIPMDRILVGAQQQRTPLPVGMIWPDDVLLADARVELFKLRNARDTVIGVASRVAAKNDGENLIEWVVHLPARGSMYVTMNPLREEGGLRRGELRTGSREFARLKGFVTERWVSDSSGVEDAPDGRIELDTTYVGELEPLE